MAAALIWIKSSGPILIFAPGAAGSHANVSIKGPLAKISSSGALDLTSLQASAARWIANVKSAPLAGAPEASLHQRQHVELMERRRRRQRVSSCNEYAGAPRMDGHFSFAKKQVAARYPRTAPPPAEKSLAAIRCRRNEFATTLPRCVDVDQFRCTRPQFLLASSRPRSTWTKRNAIVCCSPPTFGRRSRIS